MFSSLVAFALLLPPQDGSLVIPPLTAKWYQETVALVEDAVGQGDWTEAARLAERLPKPKVSVQWDTSQASTEIVHLVEQVQQTLIEKWDQTFGKEIDLKFSLGGDLKVSFTDSLPPNIDSRGPAGAVFVTSPDSGDPVVEAVIAWKRGTPPRSIEPTDLYNEVLFAIGTRLGRARTPQPGRMMFRTESEYRDINMPMKSEVKPIKELIALADAIRKAVAEKRDPGVRPAQIFVVPQKLTPVPVSQGEEMPVDVQITNQGTGVMKFAVVPDCGCFIVGPYDNTLLPNETTIVPVKINTMEFISKLDKTLYVYSNDPERPIIPIHLDTYVRPAYRFINQFSDPVFYVGKSGGIVEVALAIDPAVKFNVKAVEALGINASAEFEPWSGMVNDPLSGEPPTRMNGILIKALVSPNLVTGRGDIGFQVTTDSPLFKTLHYSVSVQKGIAAIPASFYFGTVGKSQVRASVVVSRPGRPFSIVKVESDTEFVTARIEPYQGEGNFRVVAVYSGQAVLGRFFGKVTVHTDDPSEPKIEIPFEGNVQ